MTLGLSRRRQTGVVNGPVLGSAARQTSKKQDDCITRAMLDMF